MTYEDLQVFLGIPESEMEESSSVLYHYGVARRSGRYPWGSGDDPYQRTGTFAARVNELRKNGFTYTDPKTNVTYKGDVAIAKYMGMEAQEFRAAYSMSKDDGRIAQLETAKALREKNYNNGEIARKMGLPNESSVRSLFNEDAEAKTRAARKTAEFIKKNVDEHGMIDVGGGIEKELGISREKLNEALFILAGEGYNTFGGRVEQRTNPGKFTTLRVITPPGTPYKENEDGKITSAEIFKFDQIHYLRDYRSHDGGETFEKKWVYPASMDSKRLGVVYAEDGGLKRDGLIEIRPGCPDLDLGGSKYAQVRILVDGTHYLKGMAVYNPDLPEGMDVRFNTNKSRGTPPLGDKKTGTVLKNIKTEDPDNPFGSLIKDGITDPAKNDGFKGGQSYYYDSDGKKHLSLINKRAEEGDWGEWADKLPSQFLAKQNISLVKKQLKKSMDTTQAEFDDIMALDNPVVKANLLNSFAEGCDHTALHLQAAALPRQKYQVILPLGGISDKEIYAPNYNDGEKVALVRYPHGGTFEIPVLTVNNRNREGRKIMGTSPKDAVGINSKVAEVLSGADFDGDTVMVIPVNDKIRITHREPLAGLKDFDPKMEYPARPGMKLMTKGGTQTEMGKISNLIMDMTLLGAGDDDLEKAVRHSMVVIDAEKHKLDYKRSEQENEIKRLKKEYQGVIDPETGRLRTPAGTLVTRAKGQTTIRRRQGSPTIDPKTGKLIWKESEDFYLDKKGNKVYRTQRSSQMEDTDDARTLISKTGAKVEYEYADYANYMKHMANEARRVMVNEEMPKKDSEAAAKYKTQVAKLEAALDIAERNRPRERQAQLMAASVVDAMKKSNPDMTDSEIKKANQRALSQARAKIGAKRTTISVTADEWEAIQHNAVSTSTLKKILNHADMDKVRDLATPKNTKTISAAKIARIQALYNQGKYSNAQIAEQLGVSVSVVNKYSS